MVSEYLHHLMHARALPYVIEDYNAKDLWWGSLPGMFTAGLVPPLCGFAALEDLLNVEQPAQTDDEEESEVPEEVIREEEEIVPAEPV